MKKPLLYMLIGLAIIAIVFGALQVFGHNYDLTESSLAETSSTPIMAPILTNTPSNTITPTVTATTLPASYTATSTLTKTATKAPTSTVTLTRTPKPAPVVIVPTNTPGPTGDGYVVGTPWDYEQTPVYTPGVP